MRTSATTLVDEDKREQASTVDPLTKLAHEVAKLSTLNIQEYCTPGHRSGLLYSLLLKHLGVDDVATE